MNGPMSPALYAWVGLAAAVGGSVRYLVSVAWIAAWGSAWPWPTLLVNLAGSFIIGAYWALAGPQVRSPASAGRQAAVMTGFCGGLTTFSMFGVETWQLLDQGRPLAGLAYVGLSMGGALAAAGLGLWLGSRRA